MEDRKEQYRREAEQIRKAINARPLTDFYPLEKSGALYKCPICGSGTHANKTGALSIRKSDNRVSCFAQRCFGEKGTDTLGALRILMPDKSEKEVFENCGYPMTGADPRGTVQPGGDPAAQRAHQEQPQAAQAQPALTFKDEIARYAAALPDSEGQTYLQARGFTVDTMRRFQLGYDAARHCVTIPYNPQGSYYGRRSTLPNASRKHDNLRDVPIPLFNAAALYASDVCFVVESPLCAISIAQEGGQAVATSGTGGKSRLIDQLKKRPTAAAIVLCMDNDKPGQEAAKEIGAALEGINVFCVDGTAFVMGEEQDPQAEGYRKDPNEVLQKDGAEALRRAVKETADETRRQQTMIQQEAEAERQQQTGAGMVETFLQAIQSRKYEPLPTGITDIDKAIGGGFIRQQLVLLGAAPGAGKTALAQWIFEGMAKRGVSSVFLNLEMSREQILARSLSRIATRNGKKIRATDILQGYKWTEDQRAAILEAAAEYKTNIAAHMIYNPDNVTANLDSILAYIEDEAQRAEKAGLPSPCVVLDYLQIVNGEAREDAASVIKRAVSGLKSYAMRHNTVVFVIIAHNRQSNSTGNVGMESGRDTSALEYSADLQLALTYTNCLKRKGQQAKSPDDLTEDERKQVTLRIVKGRFGGMGREVDLYFDGETMTYTQTVNKSALPSWVKQ